MDLEVVAEQVPGLSSSFRLISLIYGNIKCAFTTQHHFLYELINCTSRSLKIIVTMVIYINAMQVNGPCTEAPLVAYG